MVVVYCGKCGKAITMYIGKSVEEITELVKNQSRHSASCAGPVLVTELKKGKGKD